MPHEHVRRLSSNRIRHKPDRRLFQPPMLQSPATGVQETPARISRRKRLEKKPRCMRVFRWLRGGRAGVNFNDFPVSPVQPPASPPPVANEPECPATRSDTGFDSGGMRRPRAHLVGDFTHSRSKPGFIDRLHSRASLLGGSHRLEAHVLPDGGGDALRGPVDGQLQLIRPEPLESLTIRAERNGAGGEPPSPSSVSSRRRSAVSSSSIRPPRITTP